MNFLKNLRLRKFPACLNHSGEISPTTEFGDNVDIAIIPVKIHLDITRAELLNPCPQIHRAATGVLIDIDQKNITKYRPKYLKYRPHSIISTTKLAKTHI